MKIQSIDIEKLREELLVVTDEQADVLLEYIAFEEQKRASEELLNLRLKRRVKEPEFSI